VNREGMSSAGAHAASIPGQFTDRQFESAVKELEAPALEGYELLTESHSVKIYRHFRESSGLYEYKIYGALPEIYPGTCIQVYNDLDYRKQWDSYVSELTELKEVPLERGSAIYWCVKYPFPLSNRDYVFVREMRELDSPKGVHSWVALSTTLNVPLRPEKSRVIRVDEFSQCLAIQTDGANGSIVYMHYFDNPKGMIPKWLINWAVQTAVPAFLSTMNDACSKYEDYKLSQKSSN
jgi:hypothetical protein